MRSTQRAGWPKVQQSEVFPDPVKELEKARKTFWKEGPVNQAWPFFCPVCKAYRKIPFHPRPGSKIQIAQIVLTTAFFTLVAWPLFGWKGLFAACPFWAVYEFIYRLRARAALRCPHCAFDPFLYAVDVEQARLEIKQHFKKKFDEKGIPLPENYLPASKSTLLENTESKQKATSEQSKTTVNFS